ncbi:MAG: endonuclease V [Candidatus Thermoplasmatota archaeon]|nr:endonuclease V [Candidatus Thermoplasmatota archaeon]
MNLFEYTYDLVRQIPQGRMSTYGAVAEALGDRVAARAVGRMMNQNPDADTMPCFKIVHSDGRLGGFGLGVADKIRRLHQESIQVRDGKIVDFETVVFHEFTTKYPLKQLRNEQITTSKTIRLDDDFEELATVVGIDVAYPASEFDEACGAGVLLDYRTREVLEEQVVFAATEFPFISTYFYYREFPLIKQVIRKLSTKPSVVLLEGNGILHPYRCGLASQAGLSLDLPTIGVAKTLLYGTMKDSQVLIHGEPRGYALQSTNRTRPVYVSPGHRISLHTSLQVVKHLSVYKNPEPLRRAHQLAQSTLAQIS